MSAAEAVAPPLRKPRRRPSVAAFVMAACLIVLAAYLVYPIILLIVLSFNTAPDILVPPPVWGIENWIEAWQVPGLVGSIFNSFQIWSLVTVISFPLAITISLVLARTNVPFSYGLEFLFWVAFILPNLATTFGWVTTSTSAGFLCSLTTANAR